MTTILIIVFLAFAAMKILTLVLSPFTQKEAKKQYDLKLDELRNNPNDPDIRQQALALGRNYSNVMRNGDGVSVFDEVALMNDIGAACAGAGATDRPKQRVASSIAADGLEQRLNAIDELKRKNVISNAEHARKRAEIIDGI